VYTVKSHVYRKATDGRTVLLYAEGMEITDDEAKRAGLVKGKPSESRPARGLVIKADATVRDDNAPAPKPLERMNLAELHEVCAGEEIDPGDANTRAELVAVIESAR